MLTPVDRHSRPLLSAASLYSPRRCPLAGSRDFTAENPKGTIVMKASSDRNISRFTCTESIYVDASPQQVWGVVTDIERTGQWSPVCRECWWKEPATGLEIGAWFHGRNEANGQVWETESQVVAAIKAVEFSWMVAGNAVLWSYTLVPEKAGTQLTESWAVQPAGFEMFDNLFKDDADAMLEARRDAAVSGIPATLKAIKAILERP